jgi:hypothetical protein
VLRSYLTACHHIPMSYGQIIEAAESEDGLKRWQLLHPPHGFYLYEEKTFEEALRDLNDDGSEGSVIVDAYWASTYVSGLFNSREAARADAVAALPWLGTAVNFGPYRSSAEDPLTTLRTLLIEKQGVPAAKVAPEARIVHDLGVDGDDASDLLNELHVRFGTDLSALERHWSQFFGVEGAGPKSMLIGVPAIIIGGAGAGMLSAALGRPLHVGVILGLLGFSGGLWLLMRRRRRLRPVTVGGLVGIVRAGHWPFDPADVR